MLRKALLMVVYGVMLGSLLVLDHLLGNGFTEILVKSYCKIFCFVKKTLRERANIYQVEETREVNVVVLFLEITVLCCTMMILNKYNKYRVDCIDKDMKSGTEINQRPEKLSLYSQTIDPTLKQAERGDEGDIYNASTYPAISSVSSLLMESICEEYIDVEESNSVQYNKDRYLWDVIEEE